MAGKGRNILVEVYTGSGYEVIGLMQSKTLTINSASIDQTDVDSGDWKVLDDRGLGDKSLSLSGAGILDTTNSPLVFVEDAVWSGELVTIRITFENGDYYISNFKIVTFDRSGELNGIVPFSFSAESTAAPTNSGVGAVGGAYWDASGGAAILGRYVPPVGCSIEELVYGII